MTFNFYCTNVILSLLTCTERSETINLAHGNHQSGIVNKTILLLARNINDSSQIYNKTDK